MKRAASLLTNTPTSSLRQSEQLTTRAVAGHRDVASHVGNQALTQAGPLGRHYSPKNVPGPSQT